jgi:hypothetical protein
VSCLLAEVDVLGVRGVGEQAVRAHLDVELVARTLTFARPKTPESLSSCSWARTILFLWYSPVVAADAVAGGAATAKTPPTSAVAATATYRIWP